MHLQQGGRNTVISQPRWSVCQSRGFFFTNRADILAQPGASHTLMSRAIKARNSRHIASCYDVSPGVTCRHLVPCAQILFGVFLAFGLAALAGEIFRVRIQTCLVVDVCHVSSESSRWCSMPTHAFFPLASGKPSPLQGVPQYARKRRR